LHPGLCSVSHAISFTEVAVMLLLTTVDVLQKIKELSGPASVFLKQTYYLYVYADLLR